MFKTHTCALAAFCAAKLVHSAAADICRLCPHCAYIKREPVCDVQNVAKVKINKSRVATNSAFMPGII